MYKCTISVQHSYSTPLSNFTIVHKRKQCVKSSQNKRITKGHKIKQCAKMITKK